MKAIFRILFWLCLVAIAASCGPVKPLQASEKVGVKQLVVFMNKVDLIDEGEKPSAADSTVQDSTVQIQPESRSRSRGLWQHLDPPKDSLRLELDSAAADTGFVIPVIEESRIDPDSVLIVPEPSAPSTSLDILQINQTLEMISQALRPAEQALPPLQPGDRIRLFILDQDSISGEIIRSIFTGEIKMQ